VVVVVAVAVPCNFSALLPKLIHIRLSETRCVSLRGDVSGVASTLAEAAGAKLPGAFPVGIDTGPHNCLIVKIGTKRSRLPTRSYVRCAAGPDPTRM